MYVIVYGGDWNRKRERERGGVSARCGWCLEAAGPCDVRARVRGERGWVSKGKKEHKDARERMMGSIELEVTRELNARKGVGSEMGRMCPETGYVEMKVKLVEIGYRRESGRVQADDGGDRTHLVDRT